MNTKKATVGQVHAIHDKPMGQPLPLLSAGRVIRPP
jgi:hypothetical protein